MRSFEKMSTLDRPLTSMWFVGHGESQHLPLMECLSLTDRHTQTHKHKTNKQRHHVFLTALPITSSIHTLCLIFRSSFTPSVYHSRVITRWPSLNSSHLSLYILSKHSFIFPGCIFCPVIKTSLSNNCDSQKSVLPTLGSFSQEINYSSVDFVVLKFMI